MTNPDDEYTATQELPKGGNHYLECPAYKEWLEEYRTAFPRGAEYKDKDRWQDGEIEVKPEE